MRSGTKATPGRPDPPRGAHRRPSAAAGPGPRRPWRLPRSGPAPSGRSSTSAQAPGRGRRRRRASLASATSSRTTGGMMPASARTAAGKRTARRTISSGVVRCSSTSWPRKPATGGPISSPATPTRPPGLLDDAGGARAAPTARGAGRRPAPPSPAAPPPRQQASVGVLGALHFSQPSLGEPSFNRLSLRIGRHRRAPG